jgi:flavin-dependent dehydrogenase
MLAALIATPGRGSAARVERTEVVVVGAGPAGAMAALAFAERGRDVVLCDWRPRLEKPCGGGIPERGMARFGSLVAHVPRKETSTNRVEGPPRDQATIKHDTPVSIFAPRE